MKAICTVLVLLTMMILGGCAHCKKDHHGDHHQKAMDHWKKMDKNNDGKVAKDEFIGMKTEKFSDMDTNKDGFLTPEESMKWKKSKKKKCDRCK